MQHKKNRGIGQQRVKPLVVIQSVIEYQALPWGYCPRCQKEENMSAMTLYLSFDVGDTPPGEARERLLDVAWKYAAREQQSGIFRKRQTVAICDTALNMLVASMGLSRGGLAAALLPHSIAGVALSLVLYATFIPGIDKKTQLSIVVMPAEKSLSSVFEHISTTRGFQPGGGVSLSYVEG